MIILCLKKRKVFILLTTFVSDLIKINPSHLKKNITYINGNNILFEEALFYAWLSATGAETVVDKKVLKNLKHLKNFKTRNADNI